MDRVEKAAGVDRSGSVTQVRRRLEGKAAALQGGTGVLQSEEDASDSGQQAGAQHYEQRHFTQQQARAHYYARQEDKGQYYTEQQGQGAQFLKELAELGGIPGQNSGRDMNAGQKLSSGSSSRRKPVNKATFYRRAEAYGRQKTQAQTTYSGQCSDNRATGQTMGMATGLAGQATVQNQQGYNYKPKEFTNSGKTILEQLKEQSEAFKEAMDPKNKKNLYDATLDMMLIEQAEKTPALKAIQARLLFKIRSVKNSGAKSSEIRIAVSKIKKVIGKAKAKVKNLQNEEQLEKKRKKAEENRRKTKEQALRRELERRKKIRKVKERNDVEESKMGLGANYGGPSEATPAEIAAMASGTMSAGEAAVSAEAGAAVDVAVADVGAVADAGAVDVSL